MSILLLRFIFILQKIDGESLSYPYSWNRMSIYIILQSFSHCLCTRLKGEKARPSNHPHIAQSYYQISIFYKEQYQYDLALQFVQRAFLIYEKKLLQGHKLMCHVQNLIEYLRDNLTGWWGCLRLYEKQYKYELF